MYYLNKKITILKKGKKTRQVYALFEGNYCCSNPNSSFNNNNTIKKI